MSAGEYLFTCVVCGKVCEVYARTNKPVYCSAACRQRAYRERLRRRRQAHFESVTGFAVEDVTDSLDAAQSLVGRLVLLACACPRYLWTTPGNSQAGRIVCGFCGKPFQRVS